MSDASAAFWAQSADSQGYYPYLGIDSRQSPGLLMQSFNSPRSLENAYGIGYQRLESAAGVGAALAEALGTLGERSTIIELQAELAAPPQSI